MRTLDDLRWPRRTERLTLGRVTRADLGPMFAYRSDPSVSRWITARAREPDAFAADFESFRALNLTVWADGQLIGDALVRVGDCWAQDEVREQARGSLAELGWCLSAAAHGRGYGTELARELLAIAFQGLGVHRVEAACFAGNTSSWRIMDKLGMRRELHGVRDSLHRDGTWLDSVRYAMLADEWAAVPQ